MILDGIEFGKNSAEDKSNEGFIHEGRKDMPINQSKGIVFVFVLLLLSSFIPYGCSNDTASNLEPPGAVAGSFFNNPIHFDNGQNIGVSGTVDYDSVVVVHDGSDNWDDQQLYYRVGIVDKDAPSIDWGPSHQYDLGVNPAVAVGEPIDDSFDCIAVEVHKSQNNDDLYYHVGKIDQSSKSITWGESIKYDRGDFPGITMAVIDGMVVVEAHQAADNTNNLIYKVGIVDPAHLTIDWGDSYAYDKGLDPSISMAFHTIIETHTSQNKNTLWYHGGHVDPVSKTVDWGPSNKYDTGVNPSVTLFYNPVDETKLTFFEVHRAPYDQNPLSNDNRLWLWTGVLDTNNYSISWGSHFEYTTGEQPHVTKSYHATVTEVHKSANPVNHLWYKIEN